MRCVGFVVSAAALLAACGGEKPAPEPAAPPPAPMINLADVAGNWTVVSMAEGSDSVLVTYTIKATAADTGWMIMLPNRPAMPLTVMVMADSVMTSVGPYESVLRKGVQVSTNSMLRLQDGKLMGTTVAHYASAGADSVVRLRITGTKAP